MKDDIEAFSALVRGIDDEHRALDRCLDDLGRAGAQGNGGDPREELVAGLLRLLEDHFEHEEQVMKTFEDTVVHAAFTSHRAAHAELLAAMTETIRREEGARLLEALRRVVTRWLGIHMEVHDNLLLRCIAARLRANGQRSSDAVVAARGL